MVKKLCACVCVCMNHCPLLPMSATGSLRVVSMTSLSALIVFTTSISPRSSCTGCMWCVVHMCGVWCVCGVGLVCVVNGVNACGCEVWMCGVDVWCGCVCVHVCVRGISIALTNFEELQLLLLYTHSKHPESKHPATDIQQQT